MNKSLHGWAPLILRLAIGPGSMVHGWAKLSRGPEHFEKLLILTNVPFPHFSSWLVPIMELLAGLAILMGVFVRISAIPLITIMLMAMITIQFRYGFSSVNTIGLTSVGPVFGPPGYEINLLYIAGLISLMLTGAGIFSIDEIIRSRFSRSI
jgi:putative oxidoreductase